MISHLPGSDKMVFSCSWSSRSWILSDLSLAYIRSFVSILLEFFPFILFFWQKTTGRIYIKVNNCESFHLREKLLEFFKNPSNYNVPMCDALCFVLLSKKKGLCLAFLFPWVIIEGDSGRVSTWNCCCFRALGAFNNYVDKRRWVDIQKSPRSVILNKGHVLCKMSTIVHSRGVGGQNWAEFGPRSCCMTPLLQSFT